MAGSSTNGAESDWRTIVSLRRELAELRLRIETLEENRWHAFSIVELEWISVAFVDACAGATLDENELSRQANAELERRARGSGDEVRETRSGSPAYMATELPPGGSRDRFLGPPSVFPLLAHPTPHREKRT